MRFHVQSACSHLYKFEYKVLKLINNSSGYRPVARTLLGGERMSASGTKSRAPQAREGRGVWGYPSSGNFEKDGYLRQHFVHFEDSLLGNKAGKSEEHKLECIIRIKLESHNLVQNIPHEPTIIYYHYYGIQNKGRLLLSNFAQLYYNTFLSVFAIFIVTTDTSTTNQCCLVQGVIYSNYTSLLVTIKALYSNQKGGYCFHYLVFTFDLRDKFF